MGRTSGKGQRITIRCGFCNLLNTNLRAGPWLILNNERLAKIFTKLEVANSNALLVFLRDNGL
jgi:hypothetical protein